MKKNILLGSVVVALSLAISNANANYGSVDSKEKNKVELTVCDIFPALCTVTPSGGNGGGVEPPKPVISYGELNK